MATAASHSALELLKCQEAQQARMEAVAHAATFRKFLMVENNEAKKQELESSEAEKQELESGEAKEHEMSLGEHLDELRLRVLNSLFALVAATVICFIDQHFYMSLVLEPHREAMRSLNQTVTIQVLRYEESFFCYLKVSLIAALIWTMPYTLYQLWLFVEAGLYEHEKRPVLFFFPFALVLFIIGVLFGYFLLIPLGLRFLAAYGGSDNVSMGFTLSSYVSLFFALTFVSGIIFEIPLVMLFLVKINLMKTKLYLENWRYSVMAIFVVAAVITPPDVVSQLLIAFPMLILYFLGILICLFSDRLQDIKKFVNSN